MLSKINEAKLKAGCVRETIDQLSVVSQGDEVSRMLVEAKNQIIELEIELSQIEISHLDSQKQATNKAAYFIASRRKRR